MRRYSRSPIVDHNKYRQTDQLYEPLRETLRKTSASKIKLTTSGVSAVTEIKNSVISREMHQFSPEQAQRLQRQILIPSDRKLKPTGDHSYIQGKRFYAIDVIQRTGNPLTQEQFRQLRRQGYTQQRIYQIGSSRDTSQKDYQTPKATPQYRSSQKQINKTETIAQYYDTSNKFEGTSNRQRMSKGLSLYRGSNNNRTSVIPDIRDNDIKNNEEQKSSQSYYFETYGHNQNGHNQNDNEVKFSPEGLPKVQSNGIRNTLVSSKQDEINVFEKDYMPKIKKSQSKSIQQSEAKGSQSAKNQTQEQIINKKYYTGNYNTEKEESIDFNNIVGKVQGSVDTSQNKDQYRFRSGTYATKGATVSNNTGTGQAGISTIKKNKSPYKYNLFSAIDQGVNTKCASFGKNQLVARQINNKNWK